MTPTIIDLNPNHRLNDIFNFFTHEICSESGCLQAVINWRQIVLILSKPNLDQLLKKEMKYLILTYMCIRFFLSGYAFFIEYLIFILPINLHKTFAATS